MKKAALVLAVLVLAVSSPAQLRTGNIYGRIVDTQGKPLPGVTVTLSGPQIARMTTFTNATGMYRYPSVYPDTGYAVKAELVNFKTLNRPNVIVTIGASSEINLTLEPGKPEEQVTSKAVPPIVEIRKTRAAWSIGRNEMQKLPTARDPWVILQLAPAVMVDRENIGGNESGEPSSFVAKGDSTNGANNVWTIDGIDITDPVVLGGAAITFDFDALEGLSVTTGGASDVTMQTGGISLNMVTRRGGDKIGGTARFYLTDRAFQSANLTTALRDRGLTDTNKIQQIKDFGANAGGPIIKNKLWWWGSYGVQDLFLYTIFDTRDQSLISNYSFKLNAQVFAGNQLEAMVTMGARERFGLNASLAKPEGDHQIGRYHWGSPIIKLQDEQTFGNSFFLSMKYAYDFAGYGSRPMVDENVSNPVTYDIANATYVPFTSAFGRSWDSFSVSRPTNNWQIMATTFHDSFLGVSHEIKAGLEYSVKKASTRSGFAQNYEVFRNFVDPLIDLGDGLVVPPLNWQEFRFGRESLDHALVKQNSVYLQDTLSKGRFNLHLGLRYDRQTPSTGAYTVETVKGKNSAWSSVFDDYAMTILVTDVPPISVKAIHSRYRWDTWSPRIGLNWDVSGDGKTVLRLALSQYGDVMAVGAFTSQPLGLGGGMRFWWNDANADDKVTLEEMFWQYSSGHAETPNQLYNIYDKDGNLTQAATDALVGGFTSDSYLAGNFWDFDWSNPQAVNYDNLTTFYRNDIDPEAKNVKTSPRTREVLLGLEREIRPDLSLSVNATYRRYDNFDWAKPFYPADIYPATPDLVIDNTQTWYTVAGTVPATITIGDVTYSMGDAAGKNWYLPVASYPGPTPYRMIDKSNAYRDYIGLDLVLTKRLSNRWFLNASVTLQDQRLHWGDSYIDSTNKWALDGKPYGNLGGGAFGKSSVLMYSRWMAKISGIYQLPLGFDVSGTFFAREGWKIPTYITLAYSSNDTWPGLYKSNTVYLQTPTKDSLPTFYDLNFRIEKKIDIGAGRMYLMADIFNVFNSAIVNRAYDAYLGTYYVDTGEFSANPTNGLYNEILNPRIWRFGIRFEF